MDKDTRLEQIAADILSGKPIDWPAVESSIDPSATTALQQLKIVAEIAGLHRRIDDDNPQPTPAAMWAHLRLLERIGSGTFGDVYRAWDTHLDREVALKLLRAKPVPAATDASLSDPARVVNEGRLLARVRHPHVITVYGAEPRDGAVGIWMEFIRGRTLHDIVKQQGVMSAREAAAIGADLCGALAAVHASGLLHRDVTARNVMREDGGRIVLMDFGAGHEDARRNAPGEGRDIAGTPLYMAPELFTGARADQRSDIYALGALLFYLVSGRFPVTGRSLDEVGAAHARGERTRLRDARPDLPPLFVRVVEKALDPDPPQRFQTAGELERALEDPAAQSLGPLPVSRRSRAIYAAAFVALAFTIGVVLSVLRTPAGGGPGERSNGSALLSAARMTTRKLSPNPEVWAFSNPSADGRFMAGMVGKTGDVALIDLAENTYRPLGMGSYEEGYASLGIISPDGTAIAVEWYNNENQGALRLIRSDGSGLRDLVPAPAEIRAYEWSRDGSMILALRQLDRNTNAICLIAAADGAVRQIRTIGRRTPTMMSLSPDGRYITYDQPESAESIEHDVFILDAHTNTQWPLAPSPGEDRAPFWSPDGKTVVFLSDRNRSVSLWMTPVSQGRAAGDTRLVKDDVGRVWLRGFNAAGSLHYQLSSGHAEVYVASLDDTPIVPRVISPRAALSNFYPKWSRDGRYVAYTSERAGLRQRELWVHDTEQQRDERVAGSEFGIGLPYAWSPDGTQIVAGANGQQVVLIDRATGTLDVIAEEAVRASWTPAGITYVQPKRVTVYDPATRRIVRTFLTEGPSIALFTASPDGRSVMAAHKDGRITLDETANGRRSEWHDSGVTSLGNHFMAPHASGVVYIAHRNALNGSVKTLMFWGGAGPPRELLRASEPDDFRLSGWYGDGRSVLVIRFTQRVQGDSFIRNEMLWRVPVDGSAPVSTGLTIEGLRDISIHPDGRQIAFNAGWKQGEHWVMENFLPK